MGGGAYRPPVGGRQLDRHRRPTHRLTRRAFRTKRSIDSHALSVIPPIKSEPSKNGEHSRLLHITYASRTPISLLLSITNAALTPISLLLSVAYASLTPHWSINVADFLHL
jgi:hypothetical protein